MGRDCQERSRVFGIEVRGKEKRKVEWGMRPLDFLYGLFERILYHFQDLLADFDDFLLAEAMAT